MLNTFKPAWWLPGPHLQTLWPVFTRRKKVPIVLRRERVELSDGDFLDVDWGSASTGPIVIILHGLEGSIKSVYAQTMMLTLEKQGFRAVFMHHRGCSDEHNRLQRSYHSGDTKDIASFVQLLQTREPNTPLAAIGFSMGGNILLKWLGETGANNPLAAGVAISVPFDLQACVERLQRGFSRVYQQHLLKRLQRKMTEKFAQLSLRAPVKSFFALKNFFDFDDQVTAPLHGFESATDYYSRSSCRSFLKTIATPTLIIHAKNDPFMTPDVVPTPAELSASIEFALSNAGGHVGFVAGKFPWRPVYWTEIVTPIFLQQHLISGE